MARTAGDQWDIVSSVGFTALMVSAFRALETSRAHPLIRDQYATAFVEAAAEPRITAFLGESKDESEWDAATNYLVNHLAVRTKYFDEFFTAATDSGIRQVVILAAGLDSRAYRLPWPDGTTVYEIDQVKVLEFKDQVLGDRGAKPTCDRREVAADLREDWVSALKEKGFDPAQPTAWLAEGLLAYLPGAAQDALFETITAQSAPGSRVSTESRRGRANAARWREGLAAIRPDLVDNIDISDLIYDDERRDPAEWLREHGWSVDTTDRLTLATELGRLPAAELGEFTKLWSDAYFLTARHDA